MELLGKAGGDFRAWGHEAARRGGEDVAALVALHADMAAPTHGLPAQVHRVRQFYTPLLERRYDNAAAAAPRFGADGTDRRPLYEPADMLAELALDPPSSTQDLPAPRCSTKTTWS